MGTIFGVPRALSSTVRWAGERLCSAVWTWLSFRKTGHAAIKLTTCVKESNVRIFISYHKDRPKVPSKKTSSVALGRGNPSFPPMWSLSSGPEGTARDPHGNKCLHDITGKFRCSSREGCFLSVLISTLRETYWPLTSHSSPLGLLRCLKRRDYPGDREITQFRVFPFPIFPLFYSTCFASFFF